MFFIYGKEKNAKRYQGVNLKDCTFERRLIYTTFFDDKMQAEMCVQQLNADNPNYQFIYRKRA